MIEVMIEDCVSYTPYRACPHDTIVRTRTLGITIQPTLLELAIEKYQKTNLKRYVKYTFL